MILSFNFLNSEITQGLFRDLLCCFFPVKKVKTQEGILFAVLYPAERVVFSFSGKRLKGSSR